MLAHAATVCEGCQRLLKLATRLIYVHLPPARAQDTIHDLSKLKLSPEEQVSAVALGIGLAGDLSSAPAASPRTGAAAWHGPGHRRSESRPAARQSPLPSSRGARPALRGRAAENAPHHPHHPQLQKKLERLSKHQLIFPSKPGLGGARLAPVAPHEPPQRGEPRQGGWVCSWSAQPGDPCTMLATWSSMLALFRIRMALILVHAFFPMPLPCSEHTLLASVGCKRQ
jgi:hypothetical protein